MVKIKNQLERKGSCTEVKWTNMIWDWTFLLGMLLKNTKDFVICNLNIDKNLLFMIFSKSCLYVMARSQNTFNFAYGFLIAQSLTLIFWMKHDWSIHFLYRSGFHLAVEWSNTQKHQGYIQKCNIGFLTRTQCNKIVTLNSYRPY